MARDDVDALQVARNEAIGALQEHFARNRLDVVEFERRVEQAERAMTVRELDQALVDLPVLATVVSSPAPAETMLRAVFASAVQRGAWRPPPRMRIVACAGAVDVDFSEAVFAPGETTVHVRAFMGSVRLVVPEGMRVEVSGAALFGTCTHFEQGAASHRDRRVLRVHGTALFGAIDVVVKKRPGLLEAARARLLGK